MDSKPIPDPTLLTTEALAREIKHLRELQDEKFAAIQRQFAEWRLQEERTSRDSQAAISAALAAQKEAVHKSEQSTDKQFTDMRATITDVKERQTRAEGLLSGKQSTGALMFAVMGALVAFISLSVAIFVAFRKG